MLYKLNIHAHTIFSDGTASPVKMAEMAKELGFTALVLTDHFYNNDKELASYALTNHTWPIYRRAIKEAQKVLPVIVGLEVKFGGEEVLVFGGGAISHIIENNGIKTLEHFRSIRDNYYCAMVLCHPNYNYCDFLSCLDGYERHNHGDDYFANRFPVGLQNKQAWHNSDAHTLADLEVCYNLVNKKITTECHLINYIKSNKPNGFEIPR